MSENPTPSEPPILCRHCRAKPAVTYDDTLCFRCLLERLNEEVPYACSVIREWRDRPQRDPRVAAGAPY